MTVRTMCDGCNAELTQYDTYVTAEVHGMGHGLPQQPFHWCERCARAALAVIGNRRGDLDRSNLPTASA